MLNPEGKFSDVDFSNSEQSPGRINKMVIGLDGNLWAASELGLYRFTSISQMQYQHFPHKEHPGLPPGELEALVIESDGTLWVANENGLARKGPEQFEFSQCSRVGLSKTDRNVSVSFLSTDLEGFLVMGTHGNQLRIAALNTAIRRIATGQSASSLIKRSSIWSTLTSLDGGILIGTSKGLYREKSPGLDEFDFLFPERLGKKRILSLYQAPNGEVWVGTTEGLFNLAEGTLTRLPLLILENGKRGREVI